MNHSLPAPLPFLQGLLLAFSLVTSGPGVSDDDASLPLKPDKTLRFSVDEATWMSLDISPDGEQLVIEILGDLYLLPIEGGQATPLITGMHFDSQPRFSPDGRQIVFVSDRTGGDDLWVIVPDSENQEPFRLSDSGPHALFASPAWSPDGKSVIASRGGWDLGTFELWAYHLDGGSGVRITKAKADEGGDRSDQHNALGAVYSPSGRYLYYAQKYGGFGYNLRFPQWQIARRDLLTGEEDLVTRARDSAFRPMISPDGTLVVYATRYEQQTGLRIRNLETGEDEWLAYPVQKDAQEAWFERDLLPGYAFTPDGRAIVATAGGKIVRINLQDKSVSDIPFQVDIEKQVAERLNFPYRVETGPVEARIIHDPVLSPGGDRIAFTAFARIYVQDLENGRVDAISPPGMAAAFPGWSPDGDELVYAGWRDEGGHVYRQTARAGGKPRALTRHAAFYSHPAWAPDGKRIVVLRGSAHERQMRSSGGSPTIGTDVIWLDARDGEANLVVPARGLTRPHFGPDSDRIVFHLTSGEETGSLVSMRFDGTDRREILSATGPGYFGADELAPWKIQLSPDGNHALIIQSDQLYVVRLLSPHLAGQSVSTDSPVMPLAKLTDVGASFMGWSVDGDTITWAVGNHFYQRPLDSVEFRANENDEENDEEDEEKDDEPETIAEDYEAVVLNRVRVSLPRVHAPGALALENATAITMNGEEVIEDSVILVSNGRIVEVGPRAEVDIPADYQRMDLAGKVIVPGFVDTHAHYTIRRDFPEFSEWSFLANLAYGVTTGIDVQANTVDLFSAQDMVDAGLMLGPRTFSTGEGIYDDNRFSSKQHAYNVLKRYREHYGTRNIKAYESGNRKQRQFLVQAARELGLMPTTEGGLDMKMDLTHMIDGFSGNEHNLPHEFLYDDVVQLAARTRIAITPALLVLYGGPAAENRFFQYESPHNDPKLRRFTPYPVLAAATLRRGTWIHEQELITENVARGHMDILEAGGQIGIGGHGELQGLGYHWELWSVASGGSNYIALSAATLVGAEMIGLGQDLGSITAGKLADLVILNSNPLENIRNSADIEYVMKDGFLYEGDTLDQAWPEQKPLPNQWWWHLGPDETER